MTHFKNLEDLPEMRHALIFNVKRENPPFQSSNFFRSAGAARLRLGRAPAALAERLRRSRSALKVVFQIPL